VVHNLRRIDWSRADEGFDWAHRFDEAAGERFRAAPGDAAGLADHPDFALAVPTPDHFIPSLYLAGLAAADDETPDVLVDGYAYGSLSMTSYGLGIPCPDVDGDTDVPAPPDAPPEQSNI